MHFVAMLLQTSVDPQAVQQQVQTALMAIIPMIMIFGIVCVAVIIIPFWFICKKAGMSPWLSLLNIIPLGNLVLIYVLAFAEWKVVPAPPPTWASGFPPPPPTV
jgi:hypothetical protein